MPRSGSSAGNHRNPIFEAKKKLKRKMKIRESHRNFVGKIITEARESIVSGEFFNLKKLKSFKSTLQEKLSELKGLDQEVLEYLDESKIDEGVNDSCDLTSAIQTCIVDPKTALNSENDQGKCQEVAIVSQSA